MMDELTRIEMSIAQHEEATEALRKERRDIYAIRQREREAAAGDPVIGDVVIARTNYGDAKHGDLFLVRQVYRDNDHDMMVVGLDTITGYGITIPLANVVKVNAPNIAQRLRQFVSDWDAITKTVKDAIGIYPNRPR